MADDYGSLLDAIADESRRPRATFGAQIERCVKEAINTSETETYWFNDATGLMFSTVANQEDYGSAALSTIPYLTDIEDVTVTIATSDKRRLTKASWDELHEMNSDGTSYGQPTHYAYAFKQIRLYPIPTAVYTVTIAASYTLTELSADGSTNCWVVRREGEPLIRYRASALFYGTYLRLPDRAAQFDAMASREIDRLTGSTSRRQATGRIRRSL